ncbi:MAG: hypothetical protein ABSE25_05830 [Syntrophorhabdales bacterium]|jgi:hypothetical protein
MGPKRVRAERKSVEENRFEEEHDHQPPFFAISKTVESPEMLKSWIEWFRRLNIPCAITKTCGGYVLWRKGEEIGRTRSRAVSRLIKKDVIYSFGV